jgi:ATP-dependent DNA ligase
MLRLSKPALIPPGFIESCLPAVAAAPPTGCRWIHEIKHDGYRLQVVYRVAKWPPRIP